MKVIVRRFGLVRFSVLVGLLIVNFAVPGTARVRCQICALLPPDATPGCADPIPGLWGYDDCHMDGDQCHDAGQICGA
jgi:hypothetical protein